MRFGLPACVACVAALLCAVPWSSARLAAQRGGIFMGSADDPAIQYSTRPLDNVVEDLNRRLQNGAASLTFDGRSGYLASVLDALTLPVDSQLLVFTRLSLQGRLVSPTNPRALFFGDRVALGWVRDADLLEVAAHDRTAGVAFYTLEQRKSDRPVFKREFRCLGCHMTGETLGVPGFVMFSTIPASSERPEQVVTMDQRSPLAERWGGWFVTGAGGAAAHRGNGVPALAFRPAANMPSVTGLFDPDGFRAMSSDVAALLTFSHQTHMTNLLTRAAWEARATAPALHPQSAPAPDRPQRVAALMDGLAEELVDYLFFIGEARLPTGLAGGSGFAARMSASGPRDRHGRSLYELDLRTRLMRYPCSYLIYSPAFDALPGIVKSAIYGRMWHILSGAASSEPRYRGLALADRRAIVEILRDTKPDLPEYFGRVAR